MLSERAMLKDSPLSKEALRLQVRRFLDEDAEDGDNLMDFGLTSIGVMKLVTEWKEANIEIDFVELAKRPTIDGMWDLLRQKAGMGAR